MSLSYHPNRCWPSKLRGTQPKRKGTQNTKSDLKPFPFNNFTYFFTLFSKFFSSFHHCTCLLSVSHRYLALEEVYLPFELQSQEARLYESYNWLCLIADYGDDTLYVLSSQRKLCDRTHRCDFSRLQFASCEEILMLGFCLFSRPY